MRSVHAGVVGAAAAGLARFAGLPVFALVGVLIGVPMVVGLVLLGRVVFAADDAATSRLERLLRVLLDRPDPTDRDVWDIRTALQPADPLRGTTGAGADTGATRS